MPLFIIIPNEIYFTIDKRILRKWQLYDLKLLQTTFANHESTDRNSEY